MENPNSELKLGCLPAAEAVEEEPFRRRTADLPRRAPTSALGTGTVASTTVGHITLRTDRPVSNAVRLRMSQHQRLPTEPLILTCHLVDRGVLDLEVVMAYVADLLGSPVIGFVPSNFLTNFNTFTFVINFLG